MRFEQNAVADNGADNLGFTVAGRLDENCIEMVDNTAEVYSVIDLPAQQAGMEPSPFIPRPDARDVGISGCEADDMGEPESCNGRDDDCDGLIDEETSELNACGGCGPAPMESCDGIDNDCDGVVDQVTIDVLALVEDAERIADDVHVTTVNYAWL